MSTFILNHDLTQIFAAKADTSGIEIGQKIGEGMYSVAYRCLWNDAPQIIRFFKLLPNDRLDLKRKNIEKEQMALNRLEGAGIPELLEAQQGVSLRHILQTGPQENGEPTFWEQNPIYCDTYPYVGYQLCDYISGISLNFLPTVRASLHFANGFGTHFGNTLALFHHAAREVAFPIYLTPDELKNDHAYRHIRSAVEKTVGATAIFSERQIHLALARKLSDALLPFYESPEKILSYATPIHGDLNLNNLVAYTETAQLTGILDFDKARRSLREYDFRGMALTPDMFTVSVRSYEETMRQLTGHKIKIDKALVLKLALTVHLTAANVKENLGSEAGATQLCAVDILLTQLAALDESYAPFRKVVRQDARRARKAFPGCENKIA